METSIGESLSNPNLENILLFTNVKKNNPKPIVMDPNFKNLIEQLEVELIDINKDLGSMRESKNLLGNEK